MPIDQIAIPILGALAAWLSQERRPRLQRWACIFGLIGQPFWFWASWKAEQWGIFAVSVLYGAAWLRGLWVYWIRPRETSAEVEVLSLPPGV
ncbi:hypothetical protein [Xenophilus sp.]|uniref:hypothetical protein n=1 Tax=Xenophilus sp. TaxID=1873499 RepID=UPI0037DDDC09